MNKKYYVIWILNVMAFGSLMTTAYWEYGSTAFLKILIPSAIIFGSQWGIIFAFVRKKDNIHKK